MTNRQLIRKARELWNTGERRLDRHNRRAWLKSVNRLGDNWISLIKAPKLDKKLD